MPMNILQPSQQNIDSLLILIFHDMLLWQMTFKEYERMLIQKLLWFRSSYIDQTGRLNHGSMVSRFANKLIHFNLLIRATKKRQPV